MRLSSFRQDLSLSARMVQEEVLGETVSTHAATTYVAADHLVAVLRSVVVVWKREFLGHCFNYKDIGRIEVFH